MVTVDCHLHLGLTPSQVPEWWMAELMRFYGGEYYSIDGQVIVDLLDANGTDIGLVQGGDIRRTSYHPDHPSNHDVYVPNDYTASQVEAFPDRLLGVCCLDPMRDVQAAVRELERCVTELDFRALKAPAELRALFPRRSSPRPHLREGYGTGHPRTLFQRHDPDHQYRHAVR